MNEQPLTTTRPLTSEEREQTWAEEKSQAVKAAARIHQPSVDARKAFGFAPMSLKGADYSWPGQQEDEPRYCEACNGMGWTWEDRQVDFGTKAHDKCGYHVSVIPKGVLGETSKIREELNELEDAMQQGSLVMAAVEVSDLIGAVSSFLDKHLKPIKLEDVVLFSKITERAFTNGHRKSD